MCNCLYIVASKINCIPPTPKKHCNMLMVTSPKLMFIAGSDQNVYIIEPNWNTIQDVILVCN